MLAFIMSHHPGHLLKRLWIKHSLDIWHLTFIIKSQSSSLRLPRDFPLHNLQNLSFSIVSDNCFMIALIYCVVFIFVQTCLKFVTARGTCCSVIQLPRPTGTWIQAEARHAPTLTPARARWQMVGLGLAAASSRKAPCAARAWQTSMSCLQLRQTRGPQLSPWSCRPWCARNPLRKKWQKRDMDFFF